MRTIAVFHGPNLNKLGAREPARYGSITLATLNHTLDAICAAQNYALDARQTNAESELIDWLHNLDMEVRGLVINPAGLTHTSVILRDALLMLEIPIIEVHITNIHARERFRRISYIADVVWGRIEGLGVMGYSLAIQALITKDRETID